MDKVLERLRALPAFVVGHGIGTAQVEKETILISLWLTLATAL